jgi:deoxycytidylate deaminase
MYAAKIAALRTLDLSRQVGAAVFSRRGEVLALGSNEVPKGNGGTYWSDEPGVDAREFVLGKDSNEERKRVVARELLDVVSDVSGVKVDYAALEESEQFKNTRLMHALEYGRIVHAEMCAITDAARLGVSLKGAILFTTTFPCHMCAKHIVATGIDRVIYLEPYPKSLVSDLHPDSISVDGADRGRYSSFPAVRFEHFWGITPRRYREFFERGSRKREGKLKDYALTDGEGNPRPIISLFGLWYLRLETQVIAAGVEEALKTVFRENAAGH